MSTPEKPANDDAFAKALSATLSRPLEKLCDTMLKLLDEIAYERLVRAKEIKAVRAELADLRYALRELNGRQEPLQ